MQVVSLHHLFPTELNIIKHEAATGARSPSSCTFQHPGTKSQYKRTTEGYQAVLNATSQLQHAWISFPRSDVVTVIMRF